MTDMPGSVRTAKPRQNPWPGCRSSEPRLTFGPLAEQRQPCQSLHLIGVGLIGARQAFLGIHELYGSRTDELVCEPRRVAQKILDRDRPLRRHKLDASVAFDRDLRIGKGGHIFRERIGEE
jgi:hypothetical protein